MDDVNILSIEIIDFLIYSEVIVGKRVLFFQKSCKKVWKGYSSVADLATRFFHCDICRNSSRMNSRFC